MIKSSIPAAVAAARIFCNEARGEFSGRAYAMFIAIDAGINVGFCGTMPTRARKVGRCKAEMGNELKARVPDVGEYSPRSKDVMVDLPDPEAPTRAVVVVESRLRNRDDRIGAEGREG